MATTRELATKYRELTDAEFALNGDGGGGTLDEETGKPRFYAVAGRREVLRELCTDRPQPGRTQFAAAA